MSIGKAKAEEEAQRFKNRDSANQQESKWNQVDMWLRQIGAEML